LSIVVVHEILHRTVTFQPHVLVVKAFVENRASANVFDVLCRPLLFGMIDTLEGDVLSVRVTFANFQIVKVIVAHVGKIATKLEKCF
jgi:hypothetical protein